ncbi:hypothetical protein [Kitasatospora sp. NBC_00315]|uniref:hypothetical protein n=1 Tax=Kitasatospora sp. NBC_00315 TaxID=2975963 RepID=UPI00352DBE8B
MSPMLAFAGTSGLAQGASASAAPSDHAHGGSQPGAAQIVTSIRTNSAAAHGNSSAFAFDDVGNHESPVRDVSPQQASLVLDPFD